MLTSDLLPVAHKILKFDRKEERKEHDDDGKITIAAVVSLDVAAVG